MKKYSYNPQFSSILSVCMSKICPSSIYPSSSFSSPSLEERKDHISLPRILSQNPINLINGLASKIFYIAPITTHLPSYSHILLELYKNRTAAYGGILRLHFLHISQDSLLDNSCFPYNFPWPIKNPILFLILLRANNSNSFLDQTV